MRTEMEQLTQKPDDDEQREIMQEFLAQYDPIPTERSYQDARCPCFFLTIILIFFGLTVFGIIPKFSGIQLQEELRKRPFDAKAQTALAGLIFGPIVASIVTWCATYAYIRAVRKHPTQLVWVALTLGPTLKIMVGLLMFMSLMAMATLSEEAAQIENPVLVFCVSLVGAALLPLGVYQLIRVCCWKHLIPLTVKLLEVVTDIVQQLPSMTTISFVGVFFRMVWMIFCSFGVYCLTKERETWYPKDLDKCFFTLIMTFCAVCSAWGLLMANNVCHMSYCGVFGRWYFQKKTQQPTRLSVKAALTTSFGSICFGSFPLGTVLGKGVGKILDFVGSKMWKVEYANGWAYVQCAVRGTSLIESGKIAYSITRSSNFQSFCTSDDMVRAWVSRSGFICGVAGGVSAAGVMPLFGCPAACGFLVGLFVGWKVGCAILGSITSGIKTILMCWVEDPERLKENYSEAHNALYDLQHAVGK